MRENPGWKIDAMRKSLQRQLGAEITVSKYYRAKQKAKKKIEGDLKEQYKRLWDYTETVKVTNPGSLVKIKTELTYEANIDQNGGGDQNELVVVKGQRKY